jgi:outer membrane protein OmpA-like peptidoglycan-associated protein
MAKKQNFESSMTDLMISLVVIFLLVITAVILKLNDAKKDREEKVVIIIKTLQEELNNKTHQLNIPGLKVEHDTEDPLSLDIEVAESNLKFDFNKFELNAQNKQFLSQVMPIILEVLLKYRNDIDMVKISGYTDKVGGTAGMGNIILSQARALAVLNYSLKDTFSGESNPARDFLIDKTSISGFGSGAKYLKGTDEASRRTVIKIKVKSFEMYNVAKNIQGKRI